MELEGATERRGKGTRVPMDFHVQLAHADFEESFEADGVNIGLGGLSMRAPYLPDVGERLVCRFQCEGVSEAVEAHTEVVWANDAGSHTGEFGLRFLGLDDAARMAIRQIVAAENAYVPPSPPPQRGAVEEGGLVRLSLDGVAAPLMGTVIQKDDRGITIEQDLPFLRLSRGITIEENGRRGSIQAVDLVVEGETPRLVLDIEYSAEPARSPSVMADTDEWDGAEGHGSHPVGDEGSRDPAYDTLQDAPAPSVVETNRSLTASESTVQTWPGEPAMVPESHGAALQPDVGERVTPDDASEDPVAFHGPAAFDDAAGLEVEPRPAASAPRHPGPRLTDIEEERELDFLTQGFRPRSAKVMEVIGRALAVCWGAIRHGAGVAGPLLQSGLQWARDRAWPAMRSTGRGGTAKALKTLGRVGHQLRRRSRRRTTAQIIDGGATPGRAAGAAPSLRPRSSRKPGRLVVGLAMAGLACGLVVYAFAGSSSEGNITIDDGALASVDTQEEVVAPGAAAPALLPTTREPATVVRSQEAAEAPEPDLASLSLEDLPTPDPVEPTPRTAGPMPEPTFPSPRENLEQAAPVPVQTSPLVFGSADVPGGRSFRLRMSSPVTQLVGARESQGFSVTIPGSLSLDRAGPIAATHALVRRSMILNRGDHSILTIQFEAGQTPAYRVRADGSVLEIVVATR
ncbi:MAG: PilZ domain-containing protein [Myxococcales bacterium]|nr:PilZ domain-containing protein [Myxococcales bacterium]